ncbi:MAG: ureidoglycolate lyase [Pseudomonadales bacterium]
MITLHPEPLTADAFAPFGQVIEASATPELINAGTTDKFSDLANVDLSAAGGRPQVSLYEGQPYALPFHVAMLERHPLSSQLFMPLSERPFLVVVAPPGSDFEAAAPAPLAVAPDSVRTFVTNGRQGVNYDRGTWHHPLVAIAQASWFLVLERHGPETNCDEYTFAATDPISCAAP